MATVHPHILEVINTGELWDLMDENENPYAIRVYRETVQRVPFTISSLQSAASYVLVSPLKSVVLVWHGRDSSPDDSEVANELAKDCKAEEAGRSAALSGKKAEIPKKSNEPINEVLCISEGNQAGPASDILAVFLDLFWMTLEEYRFVRCKAAQIKNDLKTLYTIERAEGASNRFRLRKLGTAIPDRQGTAPLLPFPVYHPKKIALLAVGDQYDLWFGESVTKDAQFAARHVVTTFMNQSVPLGEGITRREQGVFDGVHYDSPLRVQYQGYEDPAFRSQFEDSVTFTQRQVVNPFVFIREKHASESLCGSGLGEAGCGDGMSSMISWMHWGVGGVFTGAGAGGVGSGARASRAGEAGAKSDEQTPRKAAFHGDGSPNPHGNHHTPY